MTSTDRPTVVVHVTESLGAGTASAISDYVDATPEIEHHLIAASREGVPEEYRHRFHSVVDVRRSITGVRTARERVRALRPDFVHLHSSWAGVGYRVFPRVKGPTVLYTPHCFAFERRDVPRLVRVLFFAAEWLLRHRTDGLVACARREEALARRLGYARTCYVPNRAGVSPPAERPSERPSEKPSERASEGTSEHSSQDSVATVVGVGRLSAQKDPSHFAAVARAAVAQTAVAARFRWVGDGSSSLREELESTGVEVTGWLSREEVLGQLSGATVVLHTASWEGFPVLLLEAHELGLPMLVRRIAAFDHLPDELLGASVEELAHKLRLLLEDPDARAENVGRWRRVLQEHNVGHQALRLRQAYARRSAA